MIYIYYDNTNIGTLTLDGVLTENRGETRPWYEEGDYLTLAEEKFQEIKDHKYEVSVLNDMDMTYKVIVNGVEYHAKPVDGHGTVLDNTPPEWRDVYSDELMDAMQKHPISGYPIPFLARPYQRPERKAHEPLNRYSSRWT